MNMFTRYIKKIPYQTTAKTVLIICSCVAVFHILIMLKIISYNIVRWWRLTNDAEMYRFESISLFLNLLIVLLVVMKWWYMRYILPHKVVNIAMWILVRFLGANTIANIFSESLFEAIFFTILVGILAMCILRIQLEE